MKEKSIVNQILKYLNSLPRCKAIKLHGSVFMERGTPDILCVNHGDPYFFEVKRPRGVPTELQNKRLEQWKNVGAVCHVVFSPQEIKKLFN